MASVFDGLAGALNGAFGAPVVHTDRSGVSRTVTAVLRREPVELAAQDGGAVWEASPTMRLPLAEAAGIVRGDRIEADGRAYRVLARIATKSPAVDRFVVFDLEDVT